MKNWKINNIDFECVSLCEWQAKREGDNQVIVLYIFDDRKSRVEVRQKNEKGWILLSQSKLEDSPEIALREALKEE